MLKACPRCQELVLDTSGECKHCQKRFAPDKLPALNKFEASKLLMDRQKEKATLVEQGGNAPKQRFAWLRWPLRFLGSVLAAVSVFLVLHLLVMDLARDPKITGAVAALTLVFGLTASAALDSGFRPRVASGRLGEVERDLRLLEDEVQKLSSKK